MYGDAGADSLRGGEDKDLLYGGAGADSLYGDDGDDYIDARDFDHAADILVGGNGNDCGWWVTGEDSTIDMEGQIG